jgi:hypothetical protein
MASSPVISLEAVIPGSAALGRRLRADSRTGWSADRGVPQQLDEVRTYISSTVTPFIIHIVNPSPAVHVRNISSLFTLKPTSVSERVRRCMRPPNRCVLRVTVKFVVNYLHYCSTRMFGKIDRPRTYIYNIISRTDVIIWASALAHGKKSA